MDIVIKNGIIVDGTGNPWFRADVGIKDGKIAELNRVGISGGEKVINAKGMVVAPGFFNFHSHSDQFTAGGSKCENSLRQGLTTEVTGSDGNANYAITEDYREHVKNELHMIIGYAGEIDWTTLEEWRQRIEKRGIGENFAPFCGFNTIRRCVMGAKGKDSGRHEPTIEELEEMKTMVAQAMEEGAFGLASAIQYAPQVYTNEIMELCKVVAKYGGVHISHVRHESTYLIEAVKELIEISKKAGLPGCVTHHKVYNPSNWGKVNETMRLIDRARARGVDVMCDMYPWLYTETSLIPFSPINFGQLFSNEKIEEMHKRLRDLQSWASIKNRLREKYEKYVMEMGKVVAAPLQGTYIAYSKTHPEVADKNFYEAAEAMGLADGWEALRELYLSDEGTTLVAEQMCEEDLITVLKHPASTISTDASALEQRPQIYPYPRYFVPTHPRYYGTYPKVLERYVRDLKVLRLEEAIRKMTSLPAKFLGLWDRGLVREGMWADIVVFDPEKVKNKATYADPYEFPEGIPYVLVNGEIVIDKEKHTGVLPGKVLRKESKG